MVNEEAISLVSRKIFKKVNFFFLQLRTIDSGQLLPRPQTEVAYSKTCNLWKLHGYKTFIFGRNSKPTRPYL